jgi:hypothetical protein
VASPSGAVGSLWVSVGHAAGERAVVDVGEPRVASVSEPPAPSRVTLVRKAAGPSPHPTPDIGWGAPSQIQWQIKKRPKLAAWPLNWNRSLGPVFLHFWAKSVLN